MYIILVLFNAIVFNITCKSLSYVCKNNWLHLLEIFCFSVCVTQFCTITVDDFFLNFSLWQNIINSCPHIPYVIFETFKTQLKICLFSGTNTCLLNSIIRFRLMLCPSPTGLPVLPGSPRSMDRGEPGSTEGWTVVPPWWTGMMPDGPGLTGVLSGGFWHVKNYRGEPWRTGKGSPTWVNRVEPCWHHRSTGKDREGSWRCRRWPGSTGMEKNELSTPGGQLFTAVLPVPHG